MNNPLSASPKSAATAQHPAMAHAQVWQHVQNIPPDQRERAMSSTEYGVPILGALASNPNVSRKDVIKAASDAAADGKIPASFAVSVISEMPTDPTKVQGFLRNLYAFYLSASVHLKAAANSQPQQPQPQPGVPQQ